MWRVFAAPGPLGVKFAREFIEIEGNPVRLMGCGGRFDQARTSYQKALKFAHQEPERRFLEKRLAEVSK